MEYPLKTGGAVVIDKAEPMDAAALVAYMEIIGGESDNLTFGVGEGRFSVQEEEVYLQTIARRRTSVMLLGKVDGEIVASGVLTGDTRRRAVHNAELGISVRKPYWRQGIGDHMMQELIGFARETGILRVIHLNVRKDNQAGIALYKKNGFEQVGEHKNYFNVRGIFHDVITMDLQL